ncbi:Cys/Met metabolism PLP-dependent enzyme-domain-containing protein [Lipomyces doorenjongii]|uniref:Cys/Met metabolism PLP-dependent enzyme-domain-containing protein n=1 Tax=Lipomyces doorenjongii TaxID=383834 RepID=UPI0034CE0CED
MGTTQITPVPAETLAEVAGFGTRAVHAGSSPDPRTGAVISPISLSTTFAQKSPAVPIGKYEYSRSSNPNRDEFEQAVASLEGGKYGLAFSSGSATTATILQSLSPGSHIISGADVYGGTHRYFTKVAQSHGLETSFTTDLLTDIPALVRSTTRLIWVESPSNPTLSITDIREVARLAKQYSLFLVVDNTFLSPYLQTPLALGADIVVHSVTKYINGHSDVVMGVAVLNDDEIYQKLVFLQNAIGAVPSAFDSWLAHRGLKTLHLRSRASSENAQKVAEVLASNISTGKVLHVNYPGLEVHPNRQVVKQQHRDGLGGGMVSFRVAGGRRGAEAFCQSTKIFTLAESLGGVESLCELPALMTHAGIHASERIKSGVHDDLVRLSVGIEDGDDLVVDVLQALDRATRQVNGVSR